MRMNLTILLFVSLFCGSTLAETEVFSKLIDLENRLKESETQIEEMKNKEATNIIFSAAAVGGDAFGPFSHDTVLVYSRVITNVGNAYNYDTGIFAAPVAGFYYFTFFYHAGGEKRSKLSLIQNADVVVQSSDHSSTNDGADNGGNAAFLQLQKGDQVYVRLVAGRHVWRSDFTTFSGFLIKLVEQDSVVTAI
ncbi:complement C1q tumor necrosis factor-related protein 3-like isoform X1 [Brachyistius frenatus]|uniref:complement C1q tumor necrosis factor-related protein 3-like isoform X1 n=1 Tax=Brachyistius frenatus TaxID=100188 RepID=UPI0037E8F611